MNVPKTITLKIHPKTRKELNARPSHPIGSIGAVHLIELFHLIISRCLNAPMFSTSEAAKSSLPDWARPFWKGLTVGWAEFGWKEDAFLKASGHAEKKD